MNSNNNSSRWWKIDFHVHTPISTDFADKKPEEKSISPEDYIKAVVNARLDAVVLTDHNHCGWIEKIRAAQEKILSNRSAYPWYHDVVFFPGFEITINSGTGRIHVLAVFDPGTTQDSVLATLGVCGICENHGDAEKSFTSQGVSDVVKAVVAAKGIPILAHIDAEKGFFFGKTSVGSDMRKLVKDVYAVEIQGKNSFKDADGKETECGKFINEHFVRVYGSDAHLVENLGTRSTWVKMSSPTIDALKLALLDRDLSVKCGDELDPNRFPNAYLRELTISNVKTAGRIPGYPLVVHFSPQLTSFIGGRGTGKSTVLECVRKVVGRGGDFGGIDRCPDEVKGFYEKVLSQDSKIELVFNKDGVDYRVSWSNNDGEDKYVLEKLDGEKWVSIESGTIINRIPISVFSQKQLNRLANEQSTLMSIIDESSVVAKDDKDRQLLTTRESYIDLCKKRRDLQDRLTNAGELKAACADLDAKLKNFATKGYGADLKCYSERLKQYEALKPPVPIAETMREIATLIDGVEVPSLNNEPFGEDQELLAECSELHSVMELAITSALGSIKTAIGKVEAAITAYKNGMNASKWTTKYNEAVRQHKKIVEDLTAQEGGVFKENCYDDWIKRRADYETELKDLDRVRKEIETCNNDIKKSFDSLLQARKSLAEDRNKFIDNIIGDNKYVRMKCIPFADVRGMESEFRLIFGLGESAFADVLYNAEEKKGLFAEVYAAAKKASENPDCDNTAAILNAVQGLKDEIGAVLKGKVVGDARFGKRLQNNCAMYPDALYKFLSWFPDDKLNIKYWRGDSAAKFVSMDEGGSAGQKAAAILAFLLSHGDGILVIDQPEDDLDNSLIYDLVIKQISENKGKRQIIVATHNSNVVVNGDSELVNVMGMCNGQIMVKTKGGMGESAIRTAICSIMEGGQEALRHRYKRLSGGC